MAESSILQDYEWMEFEEWIKIEYPDMFEEFIQLPKTLIDFISQHYSYLFQEFVDATRWQDKQIVYCT